MKIKKLLSTIVLLIIVPWANSTNRCDEMAADPYDMNKPSDIVGVTTNEMTTEEALIVCEKVLQNNPDNARYQYLLGRVYLVNGDYLQALALLTKASNQGDANAQYYLGLMYGGFEKLESKLTWYRKSAEQGHIKAQTALGVAYVEGDGVKQSYEDAIKWYRKAAEQGSEIAQYNLGGLYKRGQGVKQSKILSYAWYHLAAENGYKDAVEALRKITKSMTAEEVSEAKTISPLTVKQ